jgi:uncharacterized membrane protein YozB (DUF420 family)
MNSEDPSLESLLHEVTDFGKNSIELIKLKSIDRTADFISSFVSRLLVILILTIFSVFINIGVAIWIGDLLGKVHYGFFIVAFFYALVAFVLYVFRHKLVKLPLSNYIITQLSKF